MVKSIKECIPYPSYRLSDISWLGQVPEHWSICRGKILFVTIDERSVAGKEELLTVSAQYGVIPRSAANVTMFKAESYVGYKLCWPGDLVINSLWAWAQGLGVSQYHGIVSSVYGVYRPLSRVTPRFIHLLVRSIPFQWELQVRSKGIWLSRLQLSDDGFLRAPFPLPPLAEQIGIVKYLDYVDVRIRQYINAERRLIGLLEEEKQVIVNQAVTRGLDPNVQFKPSSVEWLGDVPDHWEVCKLKHKVEMNNSTLPETTDPYFEFSYIDIGSVESGSLSEQPQKLLFHMAPSRARRIVENGDTIVSTVRTYLKATWFAENISNIICSTGFAVLTPGRDLSPKFVSYVTQSNAFTDQVMADSVGVAYPAISDTRLGSIVFCIPPLDEQAPIVEHLDKITVDIDAAIARARKQIELLQEYRTRLIADVVTGKLDVREAVAQLPEDGGEVELVDDDLNKEGQDSVVHDVDLSGMV